MVHEGVRQRREREIAAPVAKHRGERGQADRERKIREVAQHEEQRDPDQNREEAAAAQAGLVGRFPGPSPRLWVPNIHAALGR